MISSEIADIAEYAEQLFLSDIDTVALQKLLNVAADTEYLLVLVSIISIPVAM